MYLISGLRERVEFRSPQQWGDWPLVHVALGGIGPDGKYSRGRARGVIAVGDTATGLIAVGGVARGVVAVGGVAIGVVAFGCFCLGLVVFGGLAVGVVCSGGLDVGLFPASNHGLPVLELPLEWAITVMAGFSLLVCLLSVGFDRFNPTPGQGRTNRCT